MTSRSVLAAAAVVLSSWALAGCRFPSDGSIPRYAAASELPPCGAGNSSTLAYTAVEDTLWVCRGDKGWERVIGESALGKSTVTRVSPEPAGSHCPAGGIRVEAAEDVDRDGVFSDADGTPTTSFACNACTPESDEALCERAAACGTVDAEDNCFQVRAVTCLCDALQDVEFMGEPAAWRASGAAQVAPWATGGLLQADGGSRAFQGAALLYPVPADAPGFGRVEQSFRVGLPRDASPNALEYLVGITRQPVASSSSPATGVVPLDGGTAGVGTPGDGGSVFVPGGTIISIPAQVQPPVLNVAQDGRYQPVFLGGIVEPVPSRLCLGETALAAGRHAVAVAARGGSREFPEVNVDSVRLVHSDTCPVPGSVLDGTFEEANTKWETSTSGSGVALRTTTDALDGTGSGLLRITDTCAGGFAYLRSRASIPASGGWRLQAAVTVSGKAQSALLFLGQVVLSRIPMEVPGTQTLSRCIPQEYAGTVRELGASLSSSQSFLTCAPSTASIKLDNVQLVPDETCAATEQALLVNGDFERGTEAWSATTLVNNGWIAVTDAAQAHGGQGAGRLSYTSSCIFEEPEVAAGFRVPQSGLPKGAAFRFFYRLDPGFELKSGAFTSAEAGSWKEGMVCAPKQLPGFESRLAFKLMQTTCSFLSSGAPDGGVLLDDVRFTTEPSCP